MTTTRLPNTSMREGDSPPTDRGRELLADIDRIDERYTKLLVERLGPERFARLCEDAEFLDRAFRQDDELIDLRR